jgi:hypothetical protein
VGRGAICAPITHNLLRAAGTLAGSRHDLSDVIDGPLAHMTLARGATLRRHLIAVPARLARPQRRPVLHRPRTGLSTLGFDPTRFQTEPPVCYRASWQLPGPDSHRQATTSTKARSATHVTARSTGRAKHRG